MVLIKRRSKMYLQLKIFDQPYDEIYFPSFLVKNVPLVTGHKYEITEKIDLYTVPAKELAITDEDLVKNISKEINLITIFFAGQHHAEALLRNNDKSQMQKLLKKGEKLSEIRFIFIGTVWGSNFPIGIGNSEAISVNDLTFCYLYYDIGDTLRLGFFEYKGIWHDDFRVVYFI